VLQLLNIKMSHPICTVFYARHIAVIISIVKEFDSRWRLGIFLFTTAFTTALGPTQPPIQWVSGGVSLGVKRPGRKADHLPPSSARVKEYVELHLHSPKTSSWRGAQLKKSTRTILLLHLTVCKHTFASGNIILFIAAFTVFATGM
jgi:hypothetical protein